MAHVSVSAQIEAYARELMSQGVLITWKYDQEENLVILYIPTDIEDESIYPDSIAGAETVFAFLPRPIPFASETNTQVSFQERLNQAMRERKIGAVVLARALINSIDPGIFTIEHWQTGQMTPSPEKQAVVFQTLSNISNTESKD